MRDLKGLIGNQQQGGAHSPVVIENGRNVLGLGGGDRESL